ncbi:MAG TPA: YqgE/AlgH family protein [Acidobacteriota bacterium]
MIQASAKVLIIFIAFFYLFDTPPVSSRTLSNLGQGKLLVASRRMGDPRFAQSVVLLVHYSNRGAMGLMLNFPTKIAIQKAFPDVRAFAKRSDSVFIGGPVNPKKMHFLFRKFPRKVEAIHIFGDVYLSSGNESLQQVVEAVPRNPIRVYVGYAGWSAGQLEMEVDNGHWNILPPDVGLIFHKDPAHIWEEVIDRSDTVTT